MGVLRPQMWPAHPLVAQVVKHWRPVLYDHLRGLTQQAPEDGSYLASHVPLVVCIRAHPVVPGSASQISIFGMLPQASCEITNWFSPPWHSAELLPLLISKRHYVSLALVYQ